MVVTFKSGDVNFIIVVCIVNTVECNSIVFFLCYHYYCCCYPKWFIFHLVYDSEAAQFASPFDPTILCPSLHYYSSEDREYGGSVFSYDMCAAAAVHNLPNGSVKCMHGVPSSAFAGWRCVSNHIQDRFLEPRSADSPPPSTVMFVDYNEPVCLSRWFMDANVLWCGSRRLAKRSWYNHWDILPFSSAAPYARRISVISSQVCAAIALMKSLTH
jgi:hypothetical protein